MISSMLPNQEEDEEEEEEPEKKDETENKENSTGDNQDVPKIELEESNEKIMNDLEEHDTAHKKKRKVKQQ